MEKAIKKALQDSGLREREVTPFMRVRVVGLTSNQGKGVPKEGLITIWNPTEKQVSSSALISLDLVFLSVCDFVCLLCDYLGKHCNALSGLLVVSLMFCDSSFNTVNFYSSIIPSIQSNLLSSVTAK